MQLLNTLYVTLPESYVHLDNNTVRLEVEHETRLRVPLHHLSSVVCLGHTGLSAPLMHRLAAQAGNATGAGSVRGGFIHVPTLPELAALHPGMPSMALATQVQGLQIAIETALAVRSDVREVGGALH